MRVKRTITGWSFAGIWLFTVVATACMTSPGDGARVPSWTSVISFGGFTTVQSDVVTIEAFNFTTNGYETVTTATAGSTPFITAFGGTWYQWSAQSQLGQRFWQFAPSGATGVRARVRAVDSPIGVFVNYRAIDAIPCILLHGSDPDVLGLASDCASHRSDTFIYTNDYEHGSPGCGMSPPTVKDHYNVTEIPACKRADIGALIKERIDHDLVLQHHDSSFIDHGSATGPNSLFRGHRAYLRRMQNFLSVYGEKWLPGGNLPFWTPNTTIPSGFTDIKSNPANCFSDTPGCTGWIQAPHATLSPGIALPSSLTAANMCALNPTVNALHSNLDPWHGGVHVTVGGASGTFRTFDSPAATIFWPWHRYIDDLYTQWKACGFAEPP
jgi:hypothetical protein